VKAGNEAEVETMLEFYIRTRRIVSFSVLPPFSFSLFILPLYFYICINITTRIEMLVLTL
jgi:hypothetical protein